LLARKGHPLEGKALDWALLKQYPQVLLSTPDVQATGIMGNQDSDFVRNELGIQLALQTPHLFTALQVVQSTDYLLPGPPMLVEGGELGQQLIALPLPGGEELMLKYALVCHERIKHSQAHQYLLEQLLWVVEEDRKTRGLVPLAELSELL
jgi:DNA-binding transcriptional LysR family regulator